MTIWLDAHISPAIAPWLSGTWSITTFHVRELGLRDAEDVTIFAAAKTAGAAVITKDADFAELVERLGPPPQVLLLRCGNCTNAVLRTVLSKELPTALVRLADGEPLIELGAHEDIAS